MQSTQQDEIGAALDAVDAGYARLRAACSDSVGNAFRVEVADRLETQCRLNRGQMYRFFGELDDPPDGLDDPALPKGTVICKLLWKRLCITGPEVRRRFKLAARIRPRRSLTGPELPPELPELAAAVECGEIDDGHVAAVCKALDALPSSVPAKKMEIAERILVRHAKEQDHGFVTNVGKALSAYLNPDGTLDEKDRARLCGITLGPQGPDGLSRVSGWIDPENRSYLEVLQAVERPGRRRRQPRTPVSASGEQLEMHADDETPDRAATDADSGGRADPGPVGPDAASVPESEAAATADDVDSDIDPEDDPPDDVADVHEAGADEYVAAQPDTRTAPQRLHDAFKFGMRAALSSGAFGQHRGLPVTVIATTTLRELNQAALAVNDPSIPMPPPARTGGGSVLPMRDLIRMAANAIQYLAVFEDHSERPLYLGRTKRIATADQRIICYARDRGCTRPDCTEPGYHCEVNHDPAWFPDGRTDADCLFFDCEPDHAAITKGLLQTKVTDEGRLAYSDGTGPFEINLAHHPEELLKELYEDDEGDP